LQDVLPHAGALQKAAHDSEHWKFTEVESTASQRAIADHPHMHSTLTCFRISDLPLRSTPLTPRRHGLSSKRAGNEPTSPHEAIDVSSEEGNEELEETVEGQDESTSEASNEAYLQRLHDVAESKFLRALVQLNEDIETAEEQLSSLCLDAVPRQPSVLASSDAHHTHLGRETSSFVDAMGVSGQDSNTEGGTAARNLESMRGRVCGLEDRQGEATSACNSTNVGGMRRIAVKTGLLGENGKAVKAVHEALKAIQDVHCSDELMHFELCGPFWELSEVRSKCR
jgi:hypothetical protein